MQINGLGKLARYNWNDPALDPRNMIDQTVRPYVPPQEQQGYMEGTWTDPHITNIALSNAQQLLKAGVISDQQYQALMRQLAPPAPAQGD